MEREFPVFISTCHSFETNDIMVRLKIPKTDFGKPYVLIGDHTNYLMVYVSYLPQLIESLHSKLEEYNKTSTESLTVDADSK